MNRKKIKLVSLASALAAIAPGFHPSVANATTTPEANAQTGHGATTQQPNAFYNLGSDMMGLVTSTAKDGTVVAYHSSHSSHASHASHYSGR